MQQDQESISLLWPQGSAAQESFGGEQSFISDLEVPVLVSALSVGRKYDKFIRSILTALCTDKRVVDYRLDTVDDLLNNGALVECFSALLPWLNELAACRESAGAHGTPLLTAVRRFGELELYVQCVDKLGDALTRCGEALRSPGLSLLRDRMAAIRQTEAFQALRQRVPELRSGIEKMTSVTIGVNLDAQLRPCEATIVSINDRPFKGSQFINTLFSRNLASANEFTGISELHSIVESPVLSETERMRRALTEDHAFQIMLFQDLHSILNKALAPVISTIRNYTQTNTVLLTQLEEEIAFYLGVARLVRKVRNSGLPMCRPVIQDDDRRGWQLDGGYYLNLALRQMEQWPDGHAADAIVPNDISFDEGGTVFLLTGPNRGGKTTYLQTIGVVQLLAQAGCYVPGSRAQIGIADHIFTHFLVEEKPGENSGRLGEEAKRIAGILNRATLRSLVLLNESISSSSPSENLELSRNIVLGMKWIGLRAVFATHLHELAQGLEEWNEEHPQGCRVVSIVAGVVESGSRGGENSRTYKVVRMAPRGYSFALDIARKYGLDREQIAAALAGRGILPEAEDR